jgi:hypothetical protein
VSEGPSYWLEFLKHPKNQLMVAAVAGLSVLLSFPWGGDALILGGLALAAIEVVGLALVPGMRPFQQSVDSRLRSQSRESRRERLLEEVEIHGGSRYLTQYRAMRERVQSLYRMAGDAGAKLSEGEVDQLNDLTVNYLSLCLSDAVMKSSTRDELVDGVRKKLASVERELANARLGGEDEQNLCRLKAEYEDVIQRGNRLSGRRSTLDAALVAMPVRLEEVYQMVMTSPNAGNLTEMLEDSVSRLRLAEKAALDISMSTAELALDLVPQGSAQVPASRRQARRVLPQGQHPSG